MQKIIPQKLQKGDKIMVIAPSRGLKLIGADCRQIALERFNQMGLTVEFAHNTTDDKWNLLGTGSVQERVDDMMQAFEDKSVKAIFTVIGGFNSNQILAHLDYDVIRSNPKIICGFSDITAVLAAITAKTGLETYYGPHFSSIGMKKGCEYTLQNMQSMLFSDEPLELKPSDEWSDDAWFIDQEKREFIKNDGFWVLQEGEAAGTIIGGNLCTYNLLLGTPYQPKFEKDTILMIEDDAESYPQAFDRNLQALCHQSDFKNVKGMVIGRFQKGSKIDRETLEFIINNKPELRDMPVVANVDYGHTTPILTIPLGGHATMKGSKIIIQK